MYHRVDEPICDPWQLAVSPTHFEQQLRQLRQKWRPISLIELIQNIKNGTVRDRSVVVTFDDGYLDNFTHAKPLLETYQIPATFFITTENCEQQRPFWWDELQSIILETHQLPEQLNLSIASDSLSFDVGPESALIPSLINRHKTWTIAQGMPTLRSQLYYALWRKLRPLPQNEQQAVMSELRQWAGLSPSQFATPLCMEPHQLQHLSTISLFSIGAHTLTHPALADHSSQLQYNEINGSRTYLENILQTEVNLLAYPYGSHNADSVMIAKENFVGAVTTIEGVVTQASHPLKLNRLQVNNWNTARFKTIMNDWYRA